MKLLVFDSHPVQYRVPVWQTMEALSASSVHVVYASDCSVRGSMDQGFGRTIAWDVPLMAGYANTVLNSEEGAPLSGWKSLTGAGVGKAIDEIKPTAVLLTGLNYRYDLVAYWEAKMRHLPVWIRCETQDEAITRSKWKGLLRSAIYRTAYFGIDRAFYIGELNRCHYVRHWISSSRLRAARYGTVDRFAEFTDTQKMELRKSARAAAGIPENGFVIGFSGKLIPKKRPDLLYDMLEALPEEIRLRTVLYFIGSGELEEELAKMAAAADGKYGVKSVFVGFVNQSQLAPHYLAMDVLALPSQRMGETWGLVSNEAMQAGCGVVVSDAVGSGVDFGSWSRFRVFPEGNALKLAGCLCELAAFPRDFNWAAESLATYSLDATAKALLDALSDLSTTAVKGTTGPQ